MAHPLLSVGPARIPGEIQAMLLPGPLHSKRRASFPRWDRSNSLLAHPLSDSLTPWCQWETEGCCRDVSQSQQSWMVSMQASKPRECSPHLWLLGCPTCLPYTHSHQCDAGSSWAQGTSLGFPRPFQSSSVDLVLGAEAMFPPLLCCDGLSLVPLFSLQKGAAPLRRCGRTGAREGRGCPWTESCLRAEWRGLPTVMESQLR